MKKIISHILVVLLLIISISAQDNQPKLIDEFGKTSLEDMMARVIYLGGEMAKSPNSKILVKIYGGRQTSFASPYVYASLIKGYWGNTVKFPPEKLVIQFCNINNEPFRMRFYLADANNNLVNCEEKLLVPKETVLFETAEFYDSQITFDSIENSYIELDSSGEYSAYAQDALKKMLKESPESKVYLIAYLQTNFKTDYKGKIISRKTNNLDKKYLAQQMIRAARKELLKNGVSASQIGAIDGGYVNGNERRLEFWFVPKGGEIPKPKPDYLSKKAK